MVITDCVVARDTLLGYRIYRLIGLSKELKSVSPLQRTKSCLALILQKRANEKHVRCRNDFQLIIKRQLF